MGYLFRRFYIRVHLDELLIRLELLGMNSFLRLIGLWVSLFHFASIIHHSLFPCISSSTGKRRLEGRDSKRLIWKRYGADDTLDQREFKRDDRSSYM